MSARRFRSPAAADRVAAQIRRTIPQAEVVIEDDLSISIIVYEATLSPSQLALAGGHRLKAPERPDPSRPLLQRKAPRGIVRTSTVANPAEICREVFERYFRMGRLDERTEILGVLDGLGVTANTAKTYYSRYRAEKGLSQVRQARAARREVSLTTKRPKTRRVCNGVSEPVPGTFFSEIWTAADLYLRKNKRPPMLGELKEKLPYINKHTAHKAFQAWRKFHGIAPTGQYHGKRRLRT